MRRLIAFDCEGETLIGSLDDCTPAKAGVQAVSPPSRGHIENERTALLIVSGGNEIRIGAHRGMALLAADLAERGIPVFRFDRRGIGDSTGENRGFRSSAPDIAAAAATFRAETGVTRLVAFGTCDAASALALFGRDAGVDAVILANPWVIETADDLPPPAAIRARYADRLRDPAAWRRLLTGGVSPGKLARGLMRIAAPGPPPQADVIEAIADWGDAASIILATGDTTALAYAEAVRNVVHLAPIRIETTSHSFVGQTKALADAIVGRIADTQF